MADLYEAFVKILKILDKFLVDSNVIKINICLLWVNEPFKAYAAIANDILLNFFFFFNNDVKINVFKMFYNFMTSLPQRH